MARPATKAAMAPRTAPLAAQRPPSHRGYIVNGYSQGASKEDSIDQAERNEGEKAEEDDDHDPAGALCLGVRARQIAGFRIHGKLHLSTSS
jgi:hypothetical protein